MRSRLPQLLSALGALLAVISITIVVVDNGSDHGPDRPRRTITVHVGQPVADRGARDESPPGVSHAALEAGREQQEALAFTDQLPIVTPLAASEVPGCVTRLVQNRSSRRGVAPRLLVAHYTVSRNRPGWDDVNTIVRLFDTSSFQASSNFVIDSEGNCAYIVPLTDKAWTQAGFNSVSVSIEFIAMGDEGGLSAAAIAKGAQVFAHAAKLFHIPGELGAVSGCTVTKGGVVDHFMLGACGGGHHDIRPFALQPLITATALRLGAVTAADRVTCRKINSWRKAGRPGPGLWERHTVDRKRALAARGVTCTAAGPVR